MQVSEVYGTKEEQNRLFIIKLLLKQETFSFCGHYLINT